MRQGVNPDVKYEVQYSSYVNVTSDGFVILKRVVKTESFALQVTRALTCLLTDTLCRFLSCNFFLRNSSEPWTQQQGRLEPLPSLFRSYLVRLLLSATPSD